jgi:hypothetical protein
MGTRTGPIEIEVAQLGDAPDEESLAGRGLDDLPPAREEEPFLGSAEDVENGAVVGWSE